MSPWRSSSGTARLAWFAKSETENLQGSSERLPREARHTRPFAVDWRKRCSRHVVAFRLKPDESVRHGLRRLARKELQHAHDELRDAPRPSDDAIHEARKSIKKVRTILGLMEADDGSGLNRATTRLRNVNRRLSRLRDADAIVEILRKLRHENPRLLTKYAFVRIRRQLSARKSDEMNAATPSAWKEVTRDIRALRRDVKGWQSAHPQFTLLAAGIGETYRRGREALRRARKTGSAAAFHEWRKEIKALWYALRLIEGGSRQLGRDVRALHSAEAWLGDEHNVVVLCKELSDDRSICQEAADRDRLRVAADQYQCRLRQRALRRAAPVYHRRRSGYIESIRRAWNTWRQHDARKDPAFQRLPKGRV
jgi:CHAD domain-containing protein